MRPNDNFRDRPWLYVEQENNILFMRHVNHMLWIVWGDKSLLRATEKATKKAMEKQPKKHVKATEKAISDQKSNVKATEKAMEKQPKI